MKKNKESKTAIASLAFLWIIRSFSIIVIFVVLLFMVGESWNPFKFTSEELILALFFPFMVVIGLIISFWKELYGGIVTILGIILYYYFHYIQTGNTPKGWAFIIFSLPGFLFFIYGLGKLLKRK